MKNYTFYVNPILEKFFNGKNKRLKHKNNFKLKHTMTLKRKSIILDGRSPLQKKSFFEAKREKKKEIAHLTDLIGLLVMKNRQNSKRRCALKN